VKVIVKPATASTPLRVLPLAFGAARYDTVPLPVPLAPDLTVSQEALLDAVHWQALAVVTDTEPAKPCGVAVIGLRLTW
jgi:hypothetical protein